MAQGRQRQDGAQDKPGGGDDAQDRAEPLAGEGAGQLRAEAGADEHAARVEGDGRAARVPGGGVDALDDGGCGGRDSGHEQQQRYGQENGVAAKEGSGGDADGAATPRASTSRRGAARRDRGARAAAQPPVRALR